MQDKVPPTDTRRRPDQRAYENGMMTDAANLKDLLEVKQRAVRKYMELKNEKHKPVYFDEKVNPVDGLTYYVYNNKYFEHDRPKKAWGNLLDLFSEKCKPDVYQ